MSISKELKKVGVILALVLFAAWAVVQHSRTAHLRQELAEARGRADQMDSLENENKRLKVATTTREANLGQPSETPSAELLRLRGEVGILRRQVIEMSSRHTPTTAPARVTLDTSSPFNSLSNLFTAIQLADHGGMGQFLTADCNLRKHDVAEVAEALAKVQSVSMYEAADQVFATSDPLPDRNGQTALLFELKKVGEKWLLSKLRERTFSEIQDRIQSLSQGQDTGQKVLR